jgi:hypothetical protein
MAKAGRAGFIMDRDIAERARQSLRLDAAMTMRVNPPAGAFSYESDMVNSRQCMFPKGNRGGLEVDSGTPAANAYRPMVGTVGQVRCSLAGMRSVQSTIMSKAGRNAAMPAATSPGPKYIAPMPGNKPNSRASQFGKATRFVKPPRASAPGPSLFTEIKRHSPSVSFGTSSRF